NLLVLAFAFFVMVVGGIRLVRLTFILRQVSAALGIPIGYVYIVVPLSGVLIIYFALYFIIGAALEKERIAVLGKPEAV
ncbi:MAG: TRAP transporter small permease subunit, partial [candidate division KSB1 bacterium]|nr:TRAP transporter small permease subunit [candidate division KSB1 bacterium]